MPRKWWRFWIWNRSGPRGEVRVVVYTRANCPLCDHAAKFLEAERKRLGFDLRYVDIAGNAELTEKHGEWIPVVEINDKIHFRGSINPVLWRRELDR